MKKRNNKAKNLSRWRRRRRLGFEMWSSILRYQRLLFWFWIWFLVLDWILKGFVVWAVDFQWKIQKNLGFSIAFSLPISSAISLTGQLLMFVRYGKRLDQRIMSGRRQIRQQFDGIKSGICLRLFGIVDYQRGFVRLGLFVTKILKAQNDLVFGIRLFPYYEKGKLGDAYHSKINFAWLSICGLSCAIPDLRCLKETRVIWLLWGWIRGEIMVNIQGRLYNTTRGLYGFYHVIAATEYKFSFFRLNLFVSGLNFLYSLCTFLKYCLCVGQMAQLAMNKGKVAMVRTEVVKISGSMLSQRIQQFSLTLIGRLMNPSIQRMDSLVANMPKIWKLEDKIVGADLGKGLFQFNIQSEEDLQGVLQNVPYHFDGWMVSLVRWEPIISATYPSAINFWVKVSDLPMHLWEEATLKAIGKKVGLIRELDVDSGSILVTVNGFNPLIFQMVVPFDTGDEVVVSLEYEKLAKYCLHCLRLTHDAGVCPELNKKAGSRQFEEYGDRRGGLRQQQLVKQVSQSNDGGWEKPRKPAAKRALEFSGEEPNGGFHYNVERGDNSRQSHRRYDKNNTSSWGQKKSFPGTWAENSEMAGKEGAMEGLMDSRYSVQGTDYTKKGAGPVWPKPLYQPKAIPKVLQTSHKVENVSKDSVLGKEQEDSVMEDVPEVQDKSLTVGLVFSESTDDLLEDGEYQAEEDRDVQVSAEKNMEDEGNEIHEENMSALQDEGIKQNVADKNKVKGVTKAGKANRTSKKGMVDLPKPPAHT